MCIEENRDGVDGEVGVISSSRGIIARSDFGGSVGKGPCDEGALRVLMEVSEERKVGLIGNSERARLDVEGDGSVPLGLISVFVNGEVGSVCFGGCIGDDFTDCGALGSSSEGPERARVELRGDVGRGREDVAFDGVVGMGLL